MVKQIQTILAVLLLVFIATLTASRAVTEAAAIKMKEYYTRYKKDKSKRM
jgi:hypothetical protein